MPKNVIECYNTKQERLILDEKIILSPEGEERAKLLCSKEELQNIDVVYTSNCVRTLQTAKYLLYNQNLTVTIDDRLDERRVGKDNSDIYPDWFRKQYFEPEFKTEGGESQIDVQNRMSECINEIIDKHKGKRIAIFTHGYAITFYLLKFCKILDIHDGKLKYEYKNNILFDKSINAPELFKLTVDDNNEISNIEIIKYDDIPYNHGV